MYIRKTFISKLFVRIIKKYVIAQQNQNALFLIKTYIYLSQQHGIAEQMYYK